MAPLRAILLAALSLAVFSQERLDQLPLIATVALEGGTHHVQGILADGERLWVTAVDAMARKGYLFEYDLASGKRLREVEVQSGTMFHPGGLDGDEDALWIPLAEYRPASRSVIQRRSKKTLEIIASFDVSDHIGCLAVAGSMLFGANWDGRRIYEWNYGGRETRARPNPVPTRYQDLKFRYGTLIASGVAPRGKTGGAVHWIDPETLQPLRTIETGLTDRNVPFSNEGMDLRDGRLYLLPEDAPSRLFIFAAERLR